MRTLAELLEHVRSLPSATRGTFFPGYKPKSALLVPGEGKLVLPGDASGMVSLEASLQPDGVLEESDRQLAVSTLLTAPGIVIPLPKPSVQELADCGILTESLRRENPRSVALAVGVHIGSELYYGSCKIIVLENGIRFGSSAIVKFVDHWTKNEEDFCTVLLTLYRQSADHYMPIADPKSRPWKTVTALLGGGSAADKLYVSWQRDFQFAAGIYGVALNIRQNPESVRSIVINDLQSSPPDGLLVWADWVGDPNAFIRPFLAARRDGYAQLLGTRERTMSLEDHLIELQMHVREIVSLVRERSAPKKVKTWSEISQQIENIAGDHLRLTRRAMAMLEGNPYPYPERMWVFLEKLSSIALEYHRRCGNLGTSLVQYAMEVCEIEIALFDKGREFPSISDDSRNPLHAEKHVKVDDAKSPDKVGRIYFAIDTIRHQFVIDHIGLHDYP